MVESALRTRLLALFWPWAPPLGSLLASWDRKKFYLHSILPVGGGPGGTLGGPGKVAWGTYLDY